MKYVNEPWMHSMPSATLSASGKWYAAQSMDNSIMLYNAQERFTLNRKKRFTGPSSPQHPFAS